MNATSPARPFGKAEALTKQQNSNAHALDGVDKDESPLGRPRKVWDLPDLGALPPFHSSSSDEDTDAGQADDTGRNHQEVAARMALYTKDPAPERLFVRRGSPPGGAPAESPRPAANASEGPGSLVFTNLSAEGAFGGSGESDDEATPPSTPRTAPPKSG